MILSLALGLSSAAQAQESFVLPLKAGCDKTETVYAMLKNEYDEVPFAEASGIVFSERLDEFVQGRTVIFLNPKTFSYTVAVEFDEDGLTCILVNGNNFSPSTAKTSI